MDKLITDHLVKLSDNLDKAGKTQCSNIVDGLIKNQSITKIAQYVGVIGYVLKQNRAISNCIRKKRVADSGSMQEVVLNCLKEYQDGQEYGNNDWTAKYAQVIEDSPKDFESSKTDFLSVIADENKIIEHMNKVKEVGEILAQNDVEDDLFKSVIADIDTLEKILKEGDVDHRPFKLAAPRSQRGFWNRLFSPSWSGRGVQKDTELEMDNVLEGISTISMSAQQIRNSISSLQYIGTQLQGYDNIRSAIGQLSPSDWNKTLQSIQSVQNEVSNAPDTNLFQIRDLAYGISGNINNMYNQIERIQRNMFNLRQRESVKGRTYGPSASEEFGQLEMALERLSRNPLDEKSLFYSQKLHGRLEDALNMRDTQMGPDFQEWVDTSEGPSPFTTEVPQQEQPEQPEQQEIAPQPQTSQTGNLADDTAQQLTQLLGPGFTNTLLQTLEQIAQGDYGKASDADNLQSLIQGLRATAMPTEVPDNEGIAETEDINTPESLVNDFGAEEIPAEELEETDYDPETILDAKDWSRVRDPRDMTASHVNKIIKIADIVDTISPEIASILDKYIAECTKEEESFFKFPENIHVLKEDDKNILKIRGKTTVST